MTNLATALERQKDMKQSHILTDREKIEIVEKYKTGQFTCRQLGIEYGITGGSVGRILKRRKVAVNNNQSQLQRKYEINETFFDCINNEENAYFLGFLYADGYNNEQSNVIQINLQEGDRDILDKFLLALESKRPLYYKTSKTGMPNRQNQWCLAIGNVQLSKKVAMLGCVQAKSLILKFPTEEQVPSDLIRHFIRGYFDGDGSFNLSRAGEKKLIQLSLSIESTRPFCEKIQTVLKDTLGINSQLRHDKRKNENSFSLRMGGTQQVYKMLSWLYNNSTISLNRKYTKFRDIESILMENGLI